MPDPRHLLGHRAEDATARWLASHGWTILARRQRAPAGGEVDIVALDPEAVLVAVEVRARSTARMGGPGASVDGRRVARLRRSLVTIGSGGRRVTGLRVDVVSAEPIPESPSQWRLRRIPGAG